MIRGIDVVEQGTPRHQAHRDRKAAAEWFHESAVRVGCPMGPQVRHLPPLAAGPLQGRSQPNRLGHTSGGRSRTGGLDNLHRQRHGSVESVPQGRIASGAVLLWMTVRLKADTTYGGPPEERVRKCDA